MENANSTREFCNDLIEQLKKRHLVPVLQQLKGNKAAMLSFQDITDAYDQLKENYERLAIGAKDTIAAVFFELNLVRVENKLSPRLQGSVKHIIIRWGMSCKHLFFCLRIFLSIII